LSIFVIVIGADSTEKQSGPRRTIKVEVLEKRKGGST